MHEQRKSLVHFQKTRSTTDTVAIHTRSPQIFILQVWARDIYQAFYGSHEWIRLRDQNLSPNPQPHHSGPECLPFEHVSGVALSSTVERCLKMYKDVTDQLHQNTFQTNIFGPLLLDEGI